MRTLKGGVGFDSRSISSVGLPCGITRDETASGSHQNLGYGSTSSRPAGYGG
jgi:hypothetical protein